MDGLTEDIKPQWLNVIRRLQSVARKDPPGPACLTLSIIVDGDGCPVSWTEPVRTPLEPKRRAPEVVEQLTNS